jgi:hypothetical protein
MSLLALNERAAPDKAIRVYHRDKIDLIRPALRPSVASGE